MKVFISWSGDTSKAIAEILRRWLPSVIQALKPYYSPEDITKGSRWSTEISKELEECKVGLLCLTADNLEAPWLMFEAGALSKSLTAARVCPLLFGIEPSAIKGPLVQFQAAPFTKDEMNKAVVMMNQQLGPTALPADVLESVYEMWWPRLEEQVKKEMASTKSPTRHAVRSERDILEEILARVRATPALVPHIHPEALEDLADGLQRLEMHARRAPPEARLGLDAVVQSLQAPIAHILRRSGLVQELPETRRQRPPLPEQEPAGTPLLDDAPMRRETPPEPRLRSRRRR